MLRKFSYFIYTNAATIKIVTQESILTNWTIDPIYSAILAKNTFFICIGKSAIEEEV